MFIYRYIPATFNIFTFRKQFSLFLLFIPRCFWYYLDNHLFKKASQLKNFC